MKLTSSSQVQSWDEDRSSTTTPRVVPAIVKTSLPDLKANLTTHYIMTYVPSGDAHFQLTMSMTAEAFGGKEGTFIAHGTGTFAATTGLSATFESIDGTATGSLAELGKIYGEFKQEWEKSGEHKGGEVVYTFTFEV